MAETHPSGTNFTSSDGYVLHHRSYGNVTSDKVILYQHGLPGSHVEASYFDEAARDLHIRIIGVDRPGMGHSTLEPNYRLLDWPARLLSLADHLQLERFAVLGVSGGCPYALACLHKLPRTRCVGVGIIGGVWPAHLGYQGMVLATRLLFNVGAWSPWLVQKGLDSAMVRLVKDYDSHPEKLEDFLNKTFETRPGVDKAVWEANKGGIRSMLIEDSRHSMINGSQGAAWETHLVANDWGFKLEELVVEPGKLVMWHGGLDANWPVAMARAAHRLIGGAELRVFESDGHVSLLANSMNDVIETMNAMF